jgi:hypothetical protein
MGRKLATGKYKNRLALEISALAFLGMGHSYEQVGKICGVSSTTIVNIERRVLMNQGEEFDFIQHEKAKKASDQVADFANDMMMPALAFAKATMTQHRTIQQNMFRLFITCIGEWAMQENYDARNEATVQLSKKIMQVEHVQAIPYI